MSFYILQTDASKRRVGAVLSQQSEDEGDKPMAYFSRKVLLREEKCSTIEKQCLAIYRYTDHRSLEWLDWMKENNARLACWSLLLQPYQYTMEHKPRVKNGNADTLSRLAYLTTKINIAGEVGKNVVDQGSLATHT